MSRPFAVDIDALWRNTVAILASMSSLKIASYRIKRISGAEVFVGGFGDVEQAQLRESLFGANPVVALKKLRPTGDRAQRIRVVASLARELYVWHDLHHPNILPLEGFYYDESSLKTAWIATRWQKNGNILKYVETTNAGMDIRRKLALDTVQGLAYLHGLSPPVCHADIKAENTLVNDSGDAMLCDFGLARILEDVPSGLTTTSARGCTLRYAAPELIVGDGLHSLAGDVWAWGCLLLVVMTGVLPFASKDRDAAITLAISQKRPPADLSLRSLNISDYVRSILFSCWQHEQEKRPSIDWCRQALVTRSALLFDDIYSTPQDAVVNTLQLPRDTASMLALLDPLRVSKYSLEPTSHNETYEGSFGPVRRANIHSRSFSHIPEVIVKVIQSHGSWTTHMPVLEALIQELYDWNKLRHANILPLLGFYFDESSPASSVWTITSWQSHGDVLRYVKAMQLAPEARLKLALNIACGLAYLHGHSPPICHGNMDIEHVLVDERGNAQIGGFGLTRVLKGQRPDAFPSRNTSICALRYAPPEFVTRETPLSTLEGDIWSWGCVLLVVITDVQPYAGKVQDTAIREAVAQKELPVDANLFSGTLDVPDYARSILLNCWHREPEKRPSIHWCQTALSARTVLLFDDIYSKPSTRVIPPELPENMISMLASLDSIRVPTSSIEATSNAWTYEGRFGSAVQAHMPSRRSDHGPQVLVKVLWTPGNWNERMFVLEALLREFCDWKEHRHSNILPLCGFYFNESSPTSSIRIITPWYRDGHVLGYVKVRHLTLDTKVKLALDVGRGLAYLHGLSPPISHGNIDAESIYIDAYGKAVIGGIGFTRVLEEHPVEYPPRRATSRALRYTAPEHVISGKPSRSLEGDIWAWGCVVLVIMTGNLPYADKIWNAAIRESIINGELPTGNFAIPGDVPTLRAIDQTLRTCWEQDPEIRLGIELCLAVLSQKATLFTLHSTKAPFNRIPLQYRGEGTGWQAALNPDLLTVCRLELQPDFGHIPRSKSGILDISADGKIMAVADGNQLSLYDMDTVTELRAWDTSGQSSTSQGSLLGAFLPKITAACFNPKSSLIATGHADGAIRVWNLVDHTLLTELARSLFPIQSITFGNSNTVLKSIPAYADRVVNTWNAETGVLIRSISAPGVCKLVSSRDSDNCFVVAISPAAHAGGGMIWDTEHSGRFRAPNAGVVSASVPKKNLLMTTSSNPSPGKPPDENSDKKVALIAWSLELLAAGGTQDPAFQSIPTLRQGLLLGPQDDIDSLSISPDGRLAASGSSRNGNLVFWDVEKRQPLITVKGRGLRRIQDVTFRPGSTSTDGSILYSYYDADEISIGMSVKFQLMRYTIHPTGPGEDGSDSNLSDAKSRVKEIVSRLPSFLYDELPNPTRAWPATGERAQLGDTDSAVPPKLPFRSDFWDLC